MATPILWDGYHLLGFRHGQSRGSPWKVPMKIIGKHTLDGQAILHQLVTNVTIEIPMKHCKCHGIFFADFAHLPTGDSDFATIHSRSLVPENPVAYKIIGTHPNDVGTCCLYIPSVAGEITIKIAFFRAISYRWWFQYIPCSMPELPRWLPILSHRFTLLGRSSPAPLQRRFCSKIWAFPTARRAFLPWQCGAKNLMVTLW